MTAENKTRLLLNDGLMEHVPAGVIGGFVEMATERAIMEIPYRAASLYALSVGDVDWSRAIIATLSGDLVAAERERCAPTIKFTTPTDGLPEIGEYTLIYLADHSTDDEGSKYFVSRFEGRIVQGNDLVPYGWRGPGPFSFFGWQVAGWMGLGFAYEPTQNLIRKDRGCDPPQVKS